MKKRLLSLKNYTLKEYYDSYQEIEMWMWDQEKLLTPKNEHKKEITELCESLVLEMSEFPIWMRIHFLSFCMKCSEEVKYAEWLMNEVLDADYDILGEYNKYYLFWQITRSTFENFKLQSITMKKGLAKLYKNLYMAFYQALQTDRFSYIPVEQRNKEKIFVFTSQFLSENHGPTKTACDRICYLQKHLGKKVLLINTAMLVTQKGEMPFYKRNRAGYEPKYLQMIQYNFRNEKFGFFQCENNMPDSETIWALLEMVWKEKPYCIINIGGGDICADLCGTIVPEITVNTVPSEIAVTTGRFQITERDLEATDYELLQILGAKPENIEKSLFTYVFKEQIYHYTRKEMGLSENSRVLLITGWRLDYEMQGDFLQMLEKLFVENNFLEAVFMGRFEQYEQMLASYPKLQEKSHYFADQEDALAVMELCDIYVNPKRKGGGTSAAEALYKGLPVVTIPFGDVAEAAGEIFWVDDYQGMGDKIKRYCEDKSYYEKMSKQARERAEALTDSKTHFGEAFLKIEKSQDFQ